MGDWRLYFLYRERLRKVTLEDVQRVAARYLKPANRVLGEFIPTERARPRRDPAGRGLQAALAGFRPADESVRLGETFDPSPSNIESRVIRKELANGIQAAFLPKKTRGGRVVASLALHWGDEKSLTNRDAACSFAGSMLMRGTAKKSRAELQDAFDKLNASVSIGGDGATLEVRRDNLAAALRLVAEVLREPSFPAAEFEEMKRAALTGAEAQRGDPGALAGVRLARHLYAYPEGHPHYTPTIEERIGWMRKATLKDAVACYRELFGATGADFVVVGEFDADEAARLAEELFGGWKTPHAFARVPARYFERPRFENDLHTPDKANAVLRGGLNLQMRDDHPDFPAMVLANHLLGGSSVARVPARVREKEGLSYSTFTSFTSSAFDESASFRVSSIFAPENRARVEARDPRGARARRARRLQRRGGRGGQEIAARGAPPGAHAGPRARRPAGLLPLRQAHLRLGHRVREAHRRPHPGRGERGAASSTSTPSGLSVVTAGDFKKNQAPFTPSSSAGP